MSWKQIIGKVAGKSVLAWDQLFAGPERGLTGDERALLAPIFEGSLELDPVRVREPVTGLLAISQRAFVIEDTLFVPKAFVPLMAPVLIHEMVHVWQHQHGGHAYIADSLQAQFFGDGYVLLKGLREGRAWAQLNCEQQATLIQFGFEGRLLGREFAAALESALIELRAGRGASFSG